VVKWRHDGQTSRFSAAWLRKHDYHQPRPAAPCVLWDTAIAEKFPISEHDRVERDPQALASWLASVRDYGMARMTGVPPQVGALENVVSLFGMIRETNYGRVFDVRYKPDPENLADSDLALAVHTDNPYRHQVPEVQLLHCLESDIAGGDSQLVDGFHAAERLRRESPEHFETLTTVPVRFRYETSDVILENEAPLILLDPLGRLKTIRFNNRSIAPLGVPAAKVLPFYEAYRAFHRLLTSPQMMLQFRLGPGDLVIMDNRRVLHGRSAYSSTGRRHLRGCYCDIDSLLSRLAILERQAGVSR
jgi:gamma-butyrobetaine dioxygenase